MTSVFFPGVIHDVQPNGDGAERRPRPIAAGGQA